METQLARDVLGRICNYMNFKAQSTVKVRSGVKHFINRRQDVWFTIHDPHYFMD